LAEISGPWSVDSGQFSVDSGQLTVAGGQLSVAGGQSGSSLSTLATRLSTLPSPLATSRSRTAAVDHVFQTNAGIAYNAPADALTAAAIADLTAANAAVVSKTMSDVALCDITPTTMMAASELGRKYTSGHGTMNNVILMGLQKTNALFNIVLGPLAVDKFGKIVQNWIEYLMTPTEDQPKEPKASDIPGEYSLKDKEATNQDAKKVAMATLGKVFGKLGRETVEAFSAKKGKDDHKVNDEWWKEMRKARNHTNDLLKKVPNGKGDITDYWILFAVGRVREA